MDRGRRDRRRHSCPSRLRTFNQQRSCTLHNQVYRCLLPESRDIELGSLVVVRERRERTIVPWQSRYSCVEKLSDRLPRALRAESRTIRIVVHERDLLSRLVGHVEVSLQRQQLAARSWHGRDGCTLSMMKSNRSIKFPGPPCSSINLAVSCGTY